MQLELGSNKTVEISPWVGKTKRDFMRLFKDKKDKISEQDIINILVKPFINPSDIYYSGEEIQYILITLRSISISDNIVDTKKCQKCDVDINIDIPVNDMCEYFPSKYPIIDDNIKWKDIKSINAIKDVSKKYPEEPISLIELLLHIEEYKKEPISSFQQILDIADNMSLKESDETTDNFNRNRSFVGMHYKVTCDCGEENEFIYEDIPSFFDPLLPKEVK